MYIDERKQAAIGERCTNDLDCATSKTTCVEKRCQCVAKYPVLVKVRSELKCLEDKDYGEKCFNSLQCNYTSPTTECRDSRCRCRPHHDLVEDDYGIRICYRRANPGEPCQNDVQCEWMSGGDTSLTCVTGKCACSNSHVFVQDSYLIPGCYKKASLFENCEVDEQCTTSGAFCSTNGKCMCEYGYRYRKQEGCVQSM
ncbi:uncharacterized protein LOC106474535 [Limulus polyphemus]|uniref:Uncharacterized protein LOC106474535 n=1 Tax=Limulus polyphemus TaxID=6850 RepID=A0ABM1TRR2_LIMPO|nr:uncharacterized protein LOC106474535 [Limulus polyphemus]